MSKAWLLLRCSIGVAALATVASIAQAQSVDIMSSPNVVGSGARALGMGGAFIAIADDATAASWNPGGLTQLERPELSLVYDFKWNTEKFSSWSHPEIGGSYDANFNGFNYASAVYPIRRTIAGRNLVVSLNYQRQYDFDRNLDFRYRDMLGLTGGNIAGISSNIKYRQRGQLSSLSPAFGFELTQRLSLGMVLNIWDESLLPENEWEIRLDERRKFHINGVMQPWSWVRFSMKEKYTGFRGINATIGALYRATDRLQFGMVYHTKFSADVNYERRVRIWGGSGSGFTTDRRRQEIVFPSAVGVGVAYRFPNDKLTISMDVTRREWDQFLIHDPRNRQINRRRVSGVSGLPPDQHDIDPVYTVRVGAEYVFVNDKKAFQNILPSVRAGVFYDPEPATNRSDRFFGLGRGNGKPDDYYGISLGAGVLIKDRVNLDLAYVYRWGSGVRRDTFGFSGTDADVRQHTLYLSTVVYF
ncbi:MAG TPA: hypothetical protein ENN29_13775 [Candidatus Hydrogenedentes bacterium]|nr:hypothetical protein [Candidatus Hydrogenedentota bacterium]